MKQIFLLFFLFVSLNSFGQAHIGFEGRQNPNAVYFEYRGHYFDVDYLQSALYSQYNIDRVCDLYNMGSKNRKLFLARLENMVEQMRRKECRMTLSGMYYDNFDLTKKERKMDRKVIYYIRQICESILMSNGL